jgi:chromosome segregation ATPase
LIVSFSALLAGGRNERLEQQLHEGAEEAEAILGEQQQLVAELRAKLDSEMRARAEAQGQLEELGAVDRVWEGRDALGWEAEQDSVERLVEGAATVHATKVTKEAELRVHAAEARAARAEEALRRMEVQGQNLAGQLELERGVLSALEVQAARRGEAREQHAAEMTDAEQLLARQAMSGAAMGERLAHQEVEAEVLQTSLVDAQQELHRLRSAASTATSEGQKAAAAVEELEAEKVGLQRRVQLLSHELEEGAQRAVGERSAMTAAECVRERSQARAKALEREVATLEAELAAERARRRALEHEADELRRLEPVAEQLGELKEEAAEGRRAVATIEAELLQATREVQRLKSRLNDAGIEREGAQAAVAAGRDDRQMLMRELAAVRDELEGRRADQRRGLAELDTVRREASCAQLELSARVESEASRQLEAEAVSGQLERALADLAAESKRGQLAEEDAAALQSELRRVHARAEEGEAAAAAEAEARGAHQQEAEAAKQAVAELQAKSARLEAALETSTGAEAESAALRLQAGEQEQQLAHMRSLFVQLDGTRQQLEARLQRTHSEYERQVREVAREVATRREVEQHLAEAAGAQTTLRGQLRELDASRDALQQQLDEASERLEDRDGADELARRRAAAEADERRGLQRQCEAQDEALAARERELAMARAELEARAGRARQEGAEAEARSQELRAVTHDLHAMTRENQALGVQAQSVHHEKRQMQMQMRQALGRAAAAEEAAQSFEVEKENLSATYRAVIDERQLLETEAQELRAQAAAASHRCKDEQAYATQLRGQMEQDQSTRKKMHAELLAYERKVDELSQQLLSARRQAAFADEERSKAASGMAHQRQRAQAMSSEGESFQRKAAVASQHAAGMPTSLSFPSPSAPHTAFLNAVQFVHSRAGLAAQLQRGDAERTGLQRRLDEAARQQGSLSALLAEARAKEAR